MSHTFSNNLSHLLLKAILVNVCYPDFIEKSQSLWEFQWCVGNKADFCSVKLKEEPPVIAAFAYSILKAERERVSEQKNGLT